MSTFQWTSSYRSHWLSRWAHALVPLRSSPLNRTSLLRFFYEEELDWIESIERARGTSSVIPCSSSDRLDCATAPTKRIRHSYKEVEFVRTLIHVRLTVKSPHRTSSSFLHAPLKSYAVIAIIEVDPDQTRRSRQVELWECPWSVWCGRERSSHRTCLYFVD